MNKKNQKALLIHQYGGKVTVGEVPIPELKQGQVLIKVEASTINPSDRLSMEGACFERPLPSICGIQGTGRVVDARGEIAKLWIGTRVSFISPAYGSWVQYSVSTPHQIFEIQQQIPLQSAACGIVNPLTAIGFLDKFRAEGCKGGMINSAAASSLGRMLIKLCRTQKIPLLNIVRREQQKKLLEAQGARHIIVTKPGWQKQYQQMIQKYKFDCLFDAMGGGSTTQSLISGLLPGSKVFIYGALQAKPLVVSNVLQLLKGLSIDGFLIFSWWGQCSEEMQQKVRQNLNYYLKNQLSTKVYQQIGFENIEEALISAEKNASQGKIILKMV